MRADDDGTTGSSTTRKKDIDRKWIVAARDQTDQ